MKLNPLKSLLVAQALVSSALVMSAPQDISFDQFKDACKNPARFHNQIAPSNIQITCKDVQYKWTLNAPGQITLPNSRYVTTGMTSDKYNVKAKTDMVTTNDQVADCFRYKQIGEVLEVSRSITCDEIVAYPGTGAQYCKDVTDSLREDNPGAIQVVDTGHTLDYCTPKEGNNQRGQTGNNK